MFVPVNAHLWGNKLEIVLNSFDWSFNLISNPLGIFVTLK